MYLRVLTIAKNKKNELVDAAECGVDTSQHYQDDLTNENLRWSEKS